jgi:hypothetical protein
MTMNHPQNCRQGLKYDVLRKGMTVRIINLSSPRYLQEGVVLSIDDEFCGGYDLRLRMENGEIIGQVNPADLDYE